VPRDCGPEYVSLELEAGDDPELGTRAAHMPYRTALVLLLIRLR
jgi:hypothetical protein